MLLSLIGFAALGTVGYNALKDEASREKTGNVLKKTGEIISKTVKVTAQVMDNYVERQGAQMDRKYHSGKVDDETYKEFCQARDNYYNEKMNLSKPPNSDDM